MKTTIKLLEIGGRITDFTGDKLMILYKTIDGVIETFSLSILPDGKVDFVYPDNTKVEDRVSITLKAAEGNILSVQDIIPASIIDKPEFQFAFNFQKVTAIADSNRIVPATSVLNGRILDKAGKRKLDEIQIIIFASQPDTADQFLPVLSGTTENGGYFTLPNPEGAFGAAFAVAGIDGAANNIPIKLEADTTGKLRFPKRLLLVLEDAPTSTTPAGATTESDECGCNEFNFRGQRRVLDEFSYYSIIRTSDPEIKAYAIEDELISLEEILGAIPSASSTIRTGMIADPVHFFGNRLTNVIAARPVTSIGPSTVISTTHPPAASTTAAPPTTSITDAELTKLLQSVKIRKSIVRTFLDKNTILNRDNIQTLIQLNENAHLNDIVQTDTPLPLGRAELDANNQVDWDDKPTVYEATSIAYGHLLKYKQQWVADGYSLGDLVYSLPLAPGQKKQIVTFDWENRLSAINSQEIDNTESLTNSLSRDRDINEIAAGVVNEKLSGSSTATVKSGAAGLGLAIGPMVLGASGGISKSSASAAQTSMRSSSARDVQSLSDKTVQSASAVRSQRSTVIQTVTQGESYSVTAESVANYNHCHAITIQYFEVLRHFNVINKIVDAQECLFVPLPITTFDIDKARRWKEILNSALLDRSLRKVFGSLQRVKEQWEHSDFPATTFAAENLINLSGTVKIQLNLVCPAEKQEEKTRKVATTVGITTITEDETYLVPGFDASQWAWMQPLLGMSPQQFYDSFLKGQKNQDEIFQKQLGDRIARELMNNLDFKVIDDANNALPITIDATLSSGFYNGVPLAVSLRAGITNIPREKITYLQISFRQNLLLPPFTKLIVKSGSVNYRTKHKSGYLFNLSSINDDLAMGDNVMVYSAPTRDELRNPKEEDVELVNELLHHLNSNLEYYHVMIWQYMTPERRFMLLDGIKLWVEKDRESRSVASLVENKLIGVVGNSLVLPVVPGLSLNPDFSPVMIENDREEIVPLIKFYEQEPGDPLRISVPTKGVFAEAVMGKCNSCELKDENRFWRWEESPIPDSPTSISPIVAPVPAVAQPNLAPAAVTSPIINLQNAPTDAPAPAGLASLLTLLGKNDTFNDITGLSETQKNALVGLQEAFKSADSFGTKALEKAKFDKMADLLEKGKINKKDFDESAKTGNKPESLTSTEAVNDSQKKGNVSQEDADKLKRTPGEEKLELAKKQLALVDAAQKAGQISQEEALKQNAEIVKSAHTESAAAATKDGAQTTAAEIVKTHPLSRLNTLNKNSEGYRNMLDVKTTIKGTSFKVEIVNKSFDTVYIQGMRAADEQKLQFTSGPDSFPIVFHLLPKSTTFLYEGTILEGATEDDILPIFQPIAFGFLSGLDRTEHLINLPFEAGIKVPCVVGYSETESDDGNPKYTAGFKVDFGTEVLSVTDGTVVDMANAATNDIHFIRVRNDDSTYSLYEGLKENAALVRVGDRVKEKQPISLSGDLFGELQLRFSVETLNFGGFWTKIQWKSSGALGSYVPQKDKCYERESGEVPCG